MPLAVEQVSIQSDESQENDALSRLEADSYYIIQFLRRSRIAARRC
jgi:hypothetical protein